MAPKSSSRTHPSYTIGELEREARDAGFRWVIGVDEVGRGPLAGPVTGGAVLVDLRDLSWCEGVADSKKLSPKRRDVLRTRICAAAPGAHVHHVPAEEVDRRNVLGASLWAMRCGVDALCARHRLGADEVLVLVDGKQTLIDYRGPQRAAIKGDARSLSIAAASIIAKVARDRLMCELHAVYPMYGFESHKGYPTKKHLESLSIHGCCPQHRRSFAPVAATLASKTR